MSYVLGAAAGLVLGGIIGILKGLFIWHKYEKNSSGSDTDPGAAGAIYGRAMISYFVNIATLCAAFFIRDIVPFDGIAFLIATALALAFANHVWALKQKSLLKNN